MRKNRFDSNKGRWVMLLALLVAVLALSGCVVRPVVADEAGPLLPDAVSGPVIAIAPVEAASGTEVTVAGAGWRPGEIVYVNLEGTRGDQTLEAPVLVFTVDEEGRFYGTFVAPLDIFWEDATEVEVVAHSLETDTSVAVAFVFVAATPVPTTAMTATMTAPATATPTPAANVAPDNVARVMSAGLNLRSGPGTRYPVITSLGRGAQLLVLGQSADAYWLYVQTPPSLLGWVARAYTDFRGTAPVMPAPPLPTVLPPPPPPPPPPTPPTPTYPAWNGAYYANPSLAGYPVLVRNDPAIDFNWGYGAPAPGLPATFFSVRWTRAIYFEEGAYRFFINADDGVRFWIDGRLLLDAWAPAAGQPFVIDHFLGAGSHYLQVDYYGGESPNAIRVTWDYLQPAPPPGFPDWRGEYFPNRYLSGAPLVVRNDRAIDFDWSFRSPAPGIGTEDYSVRWTRRIDFAAGTYRFSTRSDDGIRVFIDGDRIIDEWRDMSGNTTYSAERYLSGSREIRVEYYQHLGPAFVYFWWEQVASPTPTRTPTPTPTRALFATSNPSSGPVGSPVTVNFGGFPGNTAVNLYIGGYVSARAADTTVYASTVTDNSGRGALAFVLPGAWPDGRPIAPGKLALLVATADFGVSASTDFDVTAPRPTVAPNPYLDVNPSSGGPGTQVRAQGGGFPANSNVNIFLSSLARAQRADQPTPIASARTDGNGNFIALFAMPGDYPNGSSIPTGKLVILAATDGFVTQASATFDYFVTPANATIRLQPNAGPPGTQVNAQGEGFPASVNVAVYLAPLDTTVGDGNPVRYAAGTTDDRGRYNLTFGFPAFWIDGSPVAQDRVVVTVATDDFAVSASAVFRNTAPAPPWTPTPTLAPTPTTVAAREPYVDVSPSAGGPGVLATLTGGDFPANTTVLVHLSSLARSRRGDEAYTAYASTVTDGAGRFLVAFPLPTQWPDGTAIATGPLLITAATEGFDAQASVTISYQGSRSDAKPTVESTLEPPTATPEPPTATLEPPTVTPEPPTATVEAPTVTPEPPTAEPEEPTPAPEPPTAAPEEPTATPEEQVLLPPDVPRPTDAPPDSQ